MAHKGFRPIGLYEYRAIIASEQACLRLLRRIRWPKGIRCPRCAYSRIWRMREHGRLEYRCRRCRHHFTGTSDTIFAKTRTPLAKWVLAIGLFKIGISARALQTELGVTYKTAWAMLDRIRQAVSTDSLVRKLSGEVEIDDTYYGGHRKGKRGRGAAGKAAVIGIRQRGGRVYTIMVPALDTQTVRELIRMYVRRGSRVYTDSLNIYRELQALGYRHATVDHGQRFVARTGAHIQGIESHWAHTKWPMMARYRKISHKHLPKYLAEGDFKRNVTQEPDFIKTVLGRLINSTL